MTSGGAMLSAFKLRNFKSFREATLPLSELTLLIGANASGKSNTLEGLQVLAWMTSHDRLSDLQFAIQNRELRVRGTLADLPLGPSSNPDMTFGCMVEGVGGGPHLDYELTAQVSAGGLRVVAER